MILFITADRIGSETGGGLVTKNEYEALAELGPVKVVNPNAQANPFDTEKNIDKDQWHNYKLAHFYSGTFPNLVRNLKTAGVKISYTAAAHDLKESKKEFKNSGLNFDFPHLTDPKLWAEYLSSYKNADVIITPSTHSKNVMKEFGCQNVTVVPHGCDIMRPTPHPKRFSVGYLGQTGPDKGLVYLLEAWAKLDYDDAILNIAGKTSTQLLYAARYYNKGNINLMGWVKSVEKFYNSCSVYVQPSVTEGFGIEILEAMNCERPVIVSDGAGAADVVESCCGKIFEKRNVDKLAEYIDWYKNNPGQLKTHGRNAMNIAKNYTWDKVKTMYQKVWKEMLS
jgi:glycosyltransferase involved in cell wall biosynthesis